MVKGTWRREWRKGGKGLSNGGVAGRGGKGPGSLNRQKTMQAGSARRTCPEAGVQLPYRNKLSIVVSARVAALRPTCRTIPSAPDSVSPSSPSASAVPIKAQAPPAVSRPPVPPPAPCFPHRGPHRYHPRILFNRAGEDAESITSTLSDTRHRRLTDG